MKVVIADYKDSMMPVHDYEKEILINGLAECEVVIYEYKDNKREEFFDIIKDADAILTAYIKIDKEAMEHAPKLKVISMNATGYDNVDLDEANKRGIGVCPVGEYCTIDVAEFTIAMMLSLVKNLKIYGNDIDLNHNWRYEIGTANKRIEDMTVGIFGFGKIGKAVGKRAKALGLTVIACDPFIPEDSGEAYHIELVTPDQIYEKADVVLNHMNLNETNYGYFSLEKFRLMEKRPYFINMGRGACVVESDLIIALENHYLKGAALDVLVDETPDLKEHPLVGRPNVILTPHAAFYTTTSITELQRISTENIVHYLLDEKDKVFRLVSQQ
ncbi:MAG: NAD(P)-dependent oxidoreductase [Vagococcus sp.]|uniref:NAD(P)-dependent oxidoreductase n=1 Tax=Vagococcus TaxID=2737 RepID=UPI002FC824F1